MKPDDIALHEALEMCSAQELWLTVRELEDGYRRDPHEGFPVSGDKTTIQKARESDG